MKDSRSLEPTETRIITINNEALHKIKHDQSEQHFTMVTSEFKSIITKLKKIIYMKRINLNVFD